MATAAGARVPLRGYERIMALTDYSNSKIVHVMVLRASTDARLVFLEQLPLAVMQTFNRHPRMRATQVRNEFALAEIQPQLTLADVSTRKLLDINVVTQDTERWEQFAERECDALLDRYTQFPFYVRAWNDSSDGIVRLMVFSDHYMSDGISGLIVLNDIVTFAAALTQQARESEASHDAPSELPLRPSLYDMWLTPRPWRLRLCRWAVALFGKAIFKHDAKRFSPVLTPRSDQADFAIPMHVNSSSALFGQGSPESMPKALARCKAERVTFFGALAASIVLAYAVASDQHWPQPTTSKANRKLFTLGADVDFNMRKRIAAPVDEDPVGTYMAMNPLASLAKDGVDLDATAFWDLARACKQELDASLTSALMPLTMLFIHENVHSNISPTLARELPMPRSIASDVNISNIGKYPFALTHDVATADGNDAVPMQIESVHVYNSNPHLGPGAIMYVTATDRLNYSMMHKYDAPVAQTLFRAYVTCLELVSEIASDERMTHVAARVVETINDSGSEDLSVKERTPPSSDVAAAVVA